MRELTPAQLSEILERHAKWSRDEDVGECANLRNANLSYADLSYANLRNADLRYANLRNANLRNADLDMSCWPLWCGGTMAELSRRTSLQLIYHAFNQLHQDADIVKALEVLRPLANKFRSECREDAPELRGDNEP